MFGSCSTVDDFYKLLKNDFAVFNSFDLYHSNTLINEGMKFDSGSNTFWQLICADEVRVTTRRQKIGTNDYQVLIVKSTASLPLKLLRRQFDSKSSTFLNYYVIFLNINVLLPTNFKFKIGTESTKKSTSQPVMVYVYTEARSITLKRTDLAFNVLDVLPPFLEEVRKIVLKDQLIKLTLSEHDSNCKVTSSSISALLFNEKALSLVTLRNLEFLSHTNEDRKIMSTYNSQLGSLLHLD